MKMNFEIPNLKFKLNKISVGKMSENISKGKLIVIIDDIDINDQFIALLVVHFMLHHKNFHFRVF
jgi:hypothetical protein